MSNTTPSSAARVSGSIQQFVLQALQQLDAVLDVVEWGIYDVLLEQNPVKRITFDVEIAQERDDCELVSVGTPFYEAMLQAVSKRGRWQVRCLDTPIEAPSLSSVDEKIHKLVHFVKCKPPKAIRYWQEDGLFFLLRFRVTFSTDDVMEEIMSVLIDAHTLADLSAWLPLIQSHWFVTSPFAQSHPTDAMTSNVLPMSNPFSLDEILAAAQVMIDPQVTSKKQVITSQHQAQLRDEVEQSQHYYAQTLAALEKQSKSTTDPIRLERIQQKLEATRRERERRQEDILRAYDVNVDITLDQAILYRAPVLLIETEVVQRTDSLPFVFRHYPFAGKLGPVVCPTCRKATSQIERKDGVWHCGCLNS